MAAAFFNSFADSTKARAISAGTEPADRIHPQVVEAMNEVGIDLSQVRPQKLTDQLARRAQMFITMGCGETCPVVPGVLRDDWKISDPKGQNLDRARGIRDEIKEKVRNLIEKNNWL